MFDFLFKTNKPFWMFWNPQSGFIGGCIAGVIIWGGLMLIIY